MCGISGFFGDFDIDALRRASAAIAHRGPDASGLWSSGDGVALAHRRLSIIDLSEAGAQPMRSDDGRVVIVFNGEIYNFRELRRELEDAGHAFRGGSDTEVLLQLYLAHGESMLGRLNGIFALAIWDARTRLMLLARDALGVKPLYFGRCSKGVAFCSEIKGLLHLLPDARELDHASLSRYMTFLWCPGEGTPLRHVRKLGPGEAMVLNAGRIARQWRWFQLTVRAGECDPIDETASIEQTKQRLREAVHGQMVADVPVGAFLSGGVDSSAIVAFAREINPEIACFTIEQRGGAEAGATDDLPYARLVAAHFKVPLRVVAIDSASMANDVASMVYQLDEPLADPSPLNVLYISRLAREHGIKVLLSGAGGDDIFSGYRRHAALWLDAWAMRAPVALRRAFEHAMSTGDQRVSFLRKAAKFAHGLSRQGDERLISYFEWSRESQLGALYTPHFKAALGADAPGAPMRDFLATLPLGSTSLERMLALEQRFFLPDHNLTYTDKMSMAVGVETRVPFLDLPLVRHAATLPAAFKQRGAEGKWVLKRAVESMLPSAIVQRRKSGFGAPLRRWMRFELRELLHDVLSPARVADRGLFSPNAVAELIRDNDRGRVDGAYLLFSMICIELWCRRFVDVSTEPTLVAAVPSAAEFPAHSPSSQ